MKFKIDKQDSDDILHLPIVVMIVHRLPWLIFGLFGGLVAAQVVGAFESLIEDRLLLAAFIPLIVYMNGAVGAQMGAFVIRDFAINSRINVSKYIWKQFRVVVVLGLVICSMLWIGVSALYLDYVVASAVSIALYVAMVSSVFTGTLIPLAFEVFDLDPANGSGPVATVVQDLLAVLIYFSVASAMLG